jgi:ubiquinone/menaquinone biosynthesis C-methylase UbiE
MAEEPVRHEVYRTSESYTREFMSHRTSTVQAAFLLPHLRSGMRLVDCGCGTGSITADLAEIVAPGEVVGIDMRESDLDHGRELAHERGLPNLEFKTASIYELPFPDGSFDAAFASNVLMHLGDPLAALKEMRRVLKPGGVVGIADTARFRVARAPTNALLDAWDALGPRVMAHNGGSPHYSFGQRALLRQAGFSRTEGHVRIAGGHGERPAGTLEETRRMAESEIVRLREAVGKVALEQGWITHPELDAMAQALMAWGEDPDAFLMLPIPCAVGWV